MGEEKTLVNVNKGQDPYSIIGNYILNHITAIEDMIAVIQINGVIIKELYMVDVDADGYFYWKSDWWEGEEDVALLDFFPVSDAERNQMEWIPVTEKLPEPFADVIVTNGIGIYIGWIHPMDNGWRVDSESEYFMKDIIAWMPRPKGYRGEQK